MSRNATKTICGKCGAHILNGLDADVLAWIARVDDEPVTHPGELQAAVSGRRTYSLEGGRLYRRFSHHLRKPSSAAYVEHRCWDMFPAEWLAPSPRPLPVSNIPPF